MHHAVANATAAAGASPNAAVLHHHDTPQAPVFPSLHPESSSAAATTTSTIIPATSISLASASRYEYTQPQSRPLSSHRQRMEEQYQQQQQPSQTFMPADVLPRSLPSGPSSTATFRPAAAVNTNSSFSQPGPPSSQDTIPETAFTTPAASQDQNPSASGLHDSSQLLQQFSEIAATREKMADPQSPGGALSRKRMADGAVKSARECSSTSPTGPMSSGLAGYPGHSGGHSRNASTISAASTASSKLGELSSELKARLSYAMVKVNNGWQTRSIGEVENLASQAASPASSTSTLHRRHGSSASPRISMPSSQPLPQTSHFDVTWKPFARTQSSVSPPNDLAGPALPALAPPAPIHASRPPQTARRNSRAKYAPSHLVQSHHASPAGTPHTPSQASPLHSTPAQREVATPVIDPILYSPNQNTREQETIEALISMGSPINSGHPVNSFSPHMGPPHRHSMSGHGLQRTALPASRLSQGQDVRTSPARKTLPSGRPSNAPRRVGLDKSSSTVSDMDVDDAYGSPRSAVSRGTPRRKLNGGQTHRPLPVSSGLGGTSRSRRKLTDADIERMLDRASTGDSSDSESEIQLPVRVPRAGSVGA